MSVLLCEKHGAGALIMQPRLEPSQQFNSDMNLSNRTRSYWKFVERKHN